MRVESEKKKRGELEAPMHEKTQLSPSKGPWQEGGTEIVAEKKK